MIYLTNLDLNKNELQNAVVQPLATAPSSPKLGQIYYNSADKVLYQFNGTAWSPVGVLYEETSTAGKVLTGLAKDGTVTTTNVKDLQLTGYTPVTDGYITAGASLETALKALDTAVKNAVAGGGEVNQYAFSNVKVGSVTVAANGKTDTVEFVAGDKITLTADAAKKQVTISVNIPEATTSAAGLMSAADKTKLEGITAGAKPNVQSDWNAASGDAAILNKPTALSDFTNDENFIDNTVSNLVNYYTKSETYTKEEVNGLIGNIPTISIQPVDSLPASGQKSNVIYLMAKTTADGTQNAYDEYLWTGSKFERIGDTTVDLSGYLKTNGDGSAVTAAFTTAGSRSNIATGETLAVIFGKIAKYLGDLKTVAFTGAYSDLTGTPTQVVRYATGTIAAGSKSATVSFTGTFVGATAVDSATGEQVLVDVDTAANSATFSIANNYANALTVTVMYS